MQFVELHREFAPLDKKAVVGADTGRFWGRKLLWPDILQRRRVILLAEASCGKTREFKNQQSRLLAEGKSAFFLAIEELADNGFVKALTSEELAAFERWREGTSNGWFFLDSVDEARLARKSFESALKHLARELGDEIARAHILVSSRITDWRGEDDFETIKQILPVREVAAAPTKISPSVNALLDPIFSESTKSQNVKSKDEPLTDPMIVQLMPLARSQYQLLAQSAGVNDVDSFLSGIFLNGLEAFTERPGDLLDLAEYWQAKGEFGSFAEMVDHSVSRKLAEPDTHRADNGVLSAMKAREGVEQIAAALTFGKSFTLRAPNHDPDPNLIAGALDVATILPDWTDQERNTLLRRGIFAPASYGRVRFHHRSTQEYLTAEWLHKLLEANCPVEEVWNLLFVELYGVETVVPSLRPVAAWLARRHPKIRDEIIRREPLVMLRSGDPGSLPLPVREKILASYAAMNAADQIVGSRLESRSLWMFADQRLAPAITEAWASNSKSDFRGELLELIRDGAIKACVELAREVASDAEAEWHFRVLALQAVLACKDEEGLKAAARQIMEAPASTDSRLAASFARTLFPVYLSTSDLLTLIRETIPAPNGSSAGFGYSLREYYIASPNAEDRRQLIKGLADLCLSPPFFDSFRRVSTQFRFVAKQVHDIAALEIKQAANEVSHDLVRLLMVAERIERQSSISKDEKGNLRDLVNQNRELSYALFWADVDEQRLNGSQSHPPIRFWQVHIGGHQTLWEFVANDSEWLFNQLVVREREDDRRLVLSAIMAIAATQTGREAAAKKASAIVSGSEVLEEDIRGYITEPEEDRAMTDHNRRMAAHEEKQKIETEAAKKSWQDFAVQLRADPSLLSDPKYLVSWKGGLFRLKHLLEWLQGRSSVQDEKALRDWRFLEEGFGRPVAEAFRDGLRKVWRLTPARRPVHTANGGITVTWQTILAYGAIGVEAAEASDWVSHLTVKEAKRAAEHGCNSEQGYPDWLDQLFASFPDAVLPVMRKAVAQEWLLTEPAVSNLIHRFSSAAFSIPPPIQTVLLAIILDHEAGRLATLNLGVDILRKSEPDVKTKAALIKMARNRLNSHRSAKRDDYALRYLAILFLLDPDYAVADLVRWIERGDAATQSERAERSFASLFDRHNSTVAGTLKCVSISSLEKLLHLAYGQIRMERDLRHEGSYTPGQRDNAESARSSVLSALVERPGPDSYEVIRRAASHPDFQMRADRFRQIAKEKAEQDAENKPWLPAEIVAMEKKHVAPIKTGDDLFRVVMAVLRDIKFDLGNADASSRPVLERAKDEDEVQKWLVEQLNLRAKGRYHAHREAEVADDDKPDVIVSSASSKVEVAIEVKHGGKGWTLRQLEEALRKQLAIDYLKPDSRRHGVLVVTQHSDRRWLEIGTKAPISFDRVMDYLSGVAKTIVHNGFGAVNVDAIGVNAWLPQARTPYKGVESNKSAHSVDKSPLTLRSAKKPSRTPSRKAN